MYDRESRERYRAFIDYEVWWHGGLNAGYRKHGAIVLLSGELSICYRGIRELCDQQANDLFY